MAIKRGGAYVDASPFVKRGGVYGAVGSLVKSDGGYLAVAVGADDLPSRGYTSAAFFGDSITAGQVASVPELAWVNLLCAQLGITDILNKGIPGTVLQNSNDAGGSARASNGRDRFVADLLGVNKRELCVIACGYNDARYVGAPSTFNVAQYQNDLSEVVAGLIAGGYSNDDIVIVAPYYITDTGLATGSTGFTGQTRGGFEAYVAAANAVAVDYGTMYADAYAGMRDNGAGSLISGDNIHPNDTGHALIADIVYQSYRANGLRRAASTTVASGDGFVSSLNSVPGVATTIEAAFAEKDMYAYGAEASGAASTNSLPITPPLPGIYDVRVRYGDGSSKSPWNVNAGVTADSASVFLADTFTDTLALPLVGHAPFKGGTWAQQVGQGGSADVRISARSSIYSAKNFDVLLNSAVPSSANYKVSAQLTRLTAIASDSIGIMARGSSSASTGYWARYNATAGQWQLYKTVAGTATMLGSLTAALAVGSVSLLELICNGSTISVNLNGTEIITATDSAITAAGFAGIRCSSSTAQTSRTGLHIDWIKGTYL